MKKSPIVITIPRYIALSEAGHQLISRFKSDIEKLSSEEESPVFGIIEGWMDLATTDKSKISSSPVKLDKELVFRMPALLDFMKGRGINRREMSNIVKKLDFSFSDTTVRIGDYIGKVWKRTIFP